MVHTTSLWDFVAQLSSTSSDGGAGGSAAKPARPAAVASSHWITHALWCPSCLILLPGGLRPIDSGGCCPGCGELWETSGQFPARGFDLTKRPCPSWHLRPCSCRFRHRKAGGQ